jgi:hypothetical protein
MVETRRERRDTMTEADANAAIAARAGLLHETADHHAKFEAAAPPHDWWDWYAAYMLARESGHTPDEAAAAAGRYMAEVKRIIVQSA